MRLYQTTFVLSVAPPPPVLTSLPHPQSEPPSPVSHFPLPIVCIPTPTYVPFYFPALWGFSMLYTHTRGLGARSHTRGSVQLLPLGSVGSLSV